jgi:hypothetical protein
MIERNSIRALVCYGAWVFRLPCAGSYCCSVGPELQHNESLYSPNTRRFRFRKGGERRHRADGAAADDGGGPCFLLDVRGEERTNIR